MQTNCDPLEVQKFKQLANTWWDKNGACKPLHDLNPLRLAFITQHTTLDKKAILDIGCGGGILTESLATNASVTGIDACVDVINVAKQHAGVQGLTIHYVAATLEEYTQQSTQTFDIITCMELLEHVPDPLSLIQHCRQLLKPEGHLFFSTLNRNLKSYLFAILGAEYILQLLPRGTHDYAKFIRPSELDAWCRHSGLRLQHLKGIGYNFLNRQYYLQNNTDVNYLAHYQLL